MAEQQEQKPQGTVDFGVLYGRKWQIKIYKPAYKDEEKTERDPEHDIGIDVSELKCVFKCKYDMNTALSVGTLVVYNLSPETEAGIIKEGFQFSVYGGYEKGQYGEIFTGDIVQIIRNRENGVDYRLEILAVKGQMEFDWNFVRASVAAQATPREIVKAVAENADQKLQPGEVSEKVSQQPLPRGKILFGKPYKYLYQLAKANNAFFQLNGKNEVDLKCLTDEIPEDMCLSLAPESGLVGTPKYTDNGIIIKMLLDARVKLGSLIKIDNSIIQGQLVNIDSTMSGKNNQIPQQQVFDESGEYQVLSITHSGDTWGDDWSTEVVGIGRNGRAGLQTAIAKPEQTLQ
jgi:hypothetical protein